MTIKEVAKIAEVSPSAVSRVINNSGYVKQEVRERVEKVIKETGYVPNFLARSLKKNDNQLIGILIPKISSHSIGKSLDGILDTLGEKNYQSLIVNTRNSSKDEIELLEVLARKNVKGIIILGSAILKGYKEFMNKYKIPIVVLGQDVSNLGVTSVIQREEKATNNMIKEILKKDKSIKKIGIIGVKEFDDAIGIKRISGIIKGSREFNIEISEIVRNGFSFEDGYIGGQELIRNNQELDLIFAVTDTLAIGAINYLTEQGIKIKDDIKVVGVGNTNLASIYNPKLSTISYDYYKGGVLSSNKIIKLINKEETDLKVYLDYELIFRETT